MMGNRCIVSSAKKIAANRRNSRKSTGPRTPGGKAYSSLNALVHGAFALAAVIPGESAEALAALRSALWKDLAPQGALEEVLVHRIASCIWRLARATRAEGELLEQYGEPVRTKAFFDPTGLSDRFMIGPAFSNADHATIDRVARYEATLERSLQRALDELERARVRRTGQDHALPQIVDLELSIEPPSVDAHEDIAPVELEDLIQQCQLDHATSTMPRPVDRERS
jgi:hypothetical protein